MGTNAREMKIRIIPATKPVLQDTALREQKLRVAAYCRVSTDSEEQLNSYYAQKNYYTQLISENPNWEMAGIFADEGISGVSMKNRTDFNRMIGACKRGRINLILTKSISRFARNTVDCLDTVRKLKAMNIGVVFEKENIDTMKESGEFLITLFSSFAQAESESLSKNVTWGIRKSMEAGNVPMHYNTLIGYRKGPDGKPEIVPEEAEIIKLIYRLYINGYSIDGIIRELQNRGIENPKGSGAWYKTTIVGILTNEKFMGDAVMQKTYTVDCISKKVRKNNGELPIIYVEDHHEPIISKTVFQWVQTERKRRAGKRKVQQKAKTEQGKYSGKYALTERLVCGECGTAYRRCTWNIRGKRKIVWRCISRLEYGKKYCHNSPTIEESRIHDAILRTINGFIDRQTLKDETTEIVRAVVGGEISEGKSVAQMQQEVMRRSGFWICCWKTWMIWN